MQVLTGYEGVPTIAPMSAQVIKLPTRIPQWDFADRLRKVRRDAGYTQEEFAQALGVGDRAYAAWEAGRNEPKAMPEIVVRLERLTGVPRAWFFGWMTEDGPDGPPPAAEWAPWDSNPQPADKASGQVIEGPWAPLAAEEEAA